MRSGGGVLMISAAQLIVGLCLLGIYEGYKVEFFSKQSFAKLGEAGKASPKVDRFIVDMSSYNFESPLSFRSPMGFIFYFAIVNNVFAMFGLAGVFNAQRELVVSFFVYNTAQMVVAFHYFVDLCAATQATFGDVSKSLTPWERAAAVFIFFNFVLSIAATWFAVKAVEEIKHKHKEEYNRLTVLSDTLQFEPDHA